MKSAITKKQVSLFKKFTVASVMALAVVGCAIDEQYTFDSSPMAKTDRGDTYVSPVCSNEDEAYSTTETTVGVFSYAGLNGSGVGDIGDENANLASIIQKKIDDGGPYILDTSITNFTDSDLSSKLKQLGFFFMTDMENQDPKDETFFPTSAHTVLNDYVHEGGVIMMTGTAGNDDADFLNLIFGWDLADNPKGGSYHRVDENAAITSFNKVDTEYLSSPSNTGAINKGTVENFTTIYGTDTQAAVAVIQYGKGYVIYLGFDYFDSGYSTELAGKTHANGSQNLNPWVTEMIPLGLEYSTKLAAGCY